MKEFFGNFVGRLGSYKTIYERIKEGDKIVGKERFYSYINFTFD